MKNFLMKQVLRMQLRNAPKEAREMVETLMEKNPDLLMKLATEVQEEMKKGKNQEAALMAVAMRNKEALQGALGAK